jgi:hypothetical protein
MELESDDRDLVHLEASSTPKSETVANVRPLIQDLGAPSIAQIEKLIGELHEARNLLESERERIQRETARYIKFTQMASASVKIISDTLSGWRQAGHPLSEFITRSPADDSTGRMGRSFGSAPEERPDPPLSNRRVGTCGRLPYAPPRPQVRYSYRPESTVARATIAYCRL